jgi:hypothetical protein
MDLTTEFFQFVKEFFCDDGKKKTLPKEPSNVLQRGHEGLQQGITSETGKKKSVSQASNEPYAFFELEVSAAVFVTADGTHCTPKQVQGSWTRSRDHPRRGGLGANGGSLERR